MTRERKIPSPQFEDLENPPVPESAQGQDPISSLAIQKSGWTFLYDKDLRLWRPVYPDRHWHFGPRTPPVPSDIDWTSAARPAPRHLQASDLNKEPIAPEQVGRAPCRWIPHERFDHTFAYDTENLSWVPIGSVDRARAAAAQRRDARKEAAIARKKAKSGGRGRKGPSLVQQVMKQRLHRLQRFSNNVVFQRLLLLGLTLGSIALMFTSFAGAALGIAGLLFWAWFIFGIVTRRGGAGGFGFVDTLAIYSMISLGLLPALIIVITIAAVRLVLRLVGG